MTEHKLIHRHYWKYGALKYEYPIEVKSYGIDHDGFDYIEYIKLGDMLEKAHYMTLEDFKGSYFQSVNEADDSEEANNSDNVNSPKHYNNHPSGIECIEVTRHMGFNIGNAVKYLWRHGKKDKDKTIEDLQKAIFYINDEIKKLENEQS